MILFSLASFLSDWWYGTCFDMLGKIIIPTDFHIFQRGWNHQPVVDGVKPPACGTVALGQLDVDDLWPPIVLADVLGSNILHFPDGIWHVWRYVGYAKKVLYVLGVLWCFIRCFFGGILRPAEWDDIGFFGREYLSRRDAPEIKTSSASSLQMAQIHLRA